LTRKFLEVLEVSTKGSNFEGKIKSLFGGVLSTNIECTKVNFNTEIKETFYGIH
jgi:hypothetical protein